MANLYWHALHLAAATEKKITSVRDEKENFSRSYPLKALYHPADSAHFRASGQESMMVFFTEAIEVYISLQGTAVEQH